MEIHSSIGLKRLNFQKVYRYLYEVQSASKLEISMGTGLSIPTIASNINELMRRGLVEEGKEFQSTGGRRAQSYTVNSKARIAIGVEILKEEIKVVALDLYGKIVGSRSIEIEFSSNDSYYSTLGEFVNDFIGKLDFPQESVLGVGIALQGLVSEDGETVVYSEILKAEGLKLETFRKLFDYDCRMFHDTETAALAEIWNSSETQNAVYLVLNRNFGGALIFNREVRGTQKLSSATLEHMTIDPDGPVCYCGRNGCAEVFCGANSLKRISGMGISDFFSSLHSGNAECRGIWKDFVKNLATVINNVNMVVNCDVIIGGYLLRFMDDDDFSMISRTVNEEGFAYGGSHAIRRSVLEDKAPAMGAALDFIDQFIALL